VKEPRLVRLLKEEFPTREDRIALLLAVGIAGLFWFFVKLSNEFPTTWTVSLEYRLPEGYAFLELPPTELEVGVRGPGWQLMKHYFFGRKPRVRWALSPSPTQPLDRMRLISHLESSIGNGIRVEQIHHDPIVIRLDRAARRKVPIVPRVFVHFAEGYGFREPLRLEPDSVVLAGAQSLVEAFNHWETDSVALEEVKTDLRERVPLAPPPNDALLLIPPEVEAIIQVEELTEKEIIVPVATVNAPDSLRIFPTAVKVQCVVGLSRYHELAPSDFRLVADLGGITPNSENNTVPLSLEEYPPYLKSVDYHPKSVTFFIPR